MGFSKHNSAFNAPSRPACDCICSGARRQDKLGFARSLNDIAAMANKAIAKSNLPTDITMKFKMNDRQQFEGSMDNIITDYDESWYLGWGLYIHWYEPIGTCAIEKYMDTANPGDLGILHNANSQANQLGASFLEGKTYQAQHQQYSENDHTYNGQRVAHFHQDN